MDMRLVAPPTPAGIIGRSVLRGGFLGAASGLVALLGAALGSAGDLVFLSPVAALAGFVVGTGCGLIAGLVLAAARWRIVASRIAVRLTAAAAATTGPAALAVTLGIAGSHAWVAVAGLLLVTFWLAFGSGAAVFYGKRDRVSRSYAAIH